MNFETFYKNKSYKISKPRERKILELIKEDVKGKKIKLRSAFIVGVDISSSAREILTDGINVVLVRPDNPNILADSIKKLLKDTTMRNRLAKNAYKLSRKNLTP